MDAGTAAPTTQKPHLSFLLPKAGLGASPQHHGHRKSLKVTGNAASGHQGLPAHPLDVRGDPKSSVLLSAASLALHTGVPARIPHSHHSALDCAAQGTVPVRPRCQHLPHAPAALRSPKFVLPAWALLGSWVSRLCHEFEPHSRISALDLDSHHPKH